MTKMQERLRKVIADGRGVDLVIENALRDLIKDCVEITLSHPGPIVKQEWLDLGCCLHTAAEVNLSTKREIADSLKLLLV